ncbi:MAG TPA: pitrilysin family protein, partial [Nitrospiria bacterium]|nr:pitrilysin family protein [Nitrospiria bacterium]
MLNKPKTKTVLFSLLWVIFTPPLPSVASETPARIVTESGLTLLVQESHSLPMVTIQVIIGGGSVRDPEGKAGLAHITADLLDEGTSTRDAVEISEAFDFMGARFSTGARADYATASLQVLKKDFESGFGLMSDILMNPRFPEKEVDRVRNEIKGQLLAEEDQPGTVADRAFNRIIFGSHPYRLPVEGTAETVGEISRSDITAFHDRYYRPNNTIIAMVGDLTVAEAEEHVNRLFSNWGPGKIPGNSPPPPPALEKSVVERIDRDLTQAHVVLGHLGIKRSNPDYYAVSVMNYILGGGGFSSRLMKNIRDERGLVYGIYSYFDALKHPGSFSVAFQTRNDQAQDAIDEILKELRSIRTRPVSDRELEEAKAFLIGSFPLKFDTTSKIAHFLTLVEFHGLGLDYLDQ